jgi:hypothetical protein
LRALIGLQHVPGDFLLTTGTLVFIFISLFLAVAQERSQFIDRLALQPARVQIPAYVLAFLALELLPAPGPVPFVYFQF